MSAARVDTAERDRRIRERGGDPACLHCQLSLAISDWLEARPEGPVHAMTVAMAMAGVVGDLLRPCTDVGRRMACLDRAVEEMGRHCGITILPREGEFLPPKESMN